MIGNKIRKMRELRNLTQEYVAEHLGMTQQNYSKLEKSESFLSEERLQKIAQILEVSIEDIKNFDERIVFSQHHFTFRENAINVLNNDIILKEIKTVYEARIDDLQNEVRYLRQLVAKLLFENP
ncbi:MAG: XRE family transcriptional regulator [Cytophagales bacterium]|nr:MAG: XRE family transcriptional regulator [Cytophagales bacterium]